MTTNPKLAALISKAQAALKGQPVLAGSICVNFGTDGVVYIYPNNQVSDIPAVAQADCTITLSLDTLAKLESGDESVIGAVLWGDLSIDGNRGLAEKFGGIIKSAASQ